MFSVIFGVIGQCTKDTKKEAKLLCHGYKLKYFYLVFTVINQHQPFDNSGSGRRCYNKFKSKVRQSDFCSVFPEDVSTLLQESLALSPEEGLQPALSLSAPDRLL